MSRRHDNQEATGKVNFYSGRGWYFVLGLGQAGISNADGTPKNGTPGFAPSCIWDNLINPGAFQNIGTNLSSQWVEVDGLAGSQTRLGSATLGAAFSTFFGQGNLYRNTANPIKGNAADTTDDILDGFVLPASAFDAANRQLMLNFNGNLAANGNNKRIKVWVNPTMAGQTVTAGVISGGTVSGVGAGVLLFDSAVQTGNNVGWQLDVVFAKIGASGTNTQYSIGASMFGSTHGGSSLGIFPTQPENAVMNFVVTGASPTTGAASDVILNQTKINAMN